MHLLGWSSRQRSYVLLSGLVIALIVLISSNGRTFRKNESIGPDEMVNFEESKDPGYVCLGYQPLTKSWGNIFLADGCPQGYGIVASSDSSGKNRFGPPQYVSLIPRCCRLPFDDILTNRNVYNVFESCPDNSVATSGMDGCGANCSMRCTYINTEKYQLGAEKQALYVRDPEREAFSGRGTAMMISLLDVPLAFRWVVTRYSFDYFEPDACVGFPFGSLLVRKSEKQCSGYYYRQLQYKDGTPVPIFPHCDAISDIYDPNAKCLIKKGEK